ncbi:MAG: MerC domain-containing protein [Lentimonas sp.]
MTTKTSCSSHGWLDSLAISMSVICAVHCLLTPILVVFLPILTTTFWVSQNFHLWMILFVVPTTGAAVFMGCRKHKDKAVLALSALGLALLVVVAGYETLFHSGLVGREHAAHCSQCAAAAKSDFFAGTPLINVIGGLLLASAHVRNYLLCRKTDCDHDHDH